MILVNYLDNIITVIIPKFQTFVTNITGKLLYVSGKKPCFETITINFLRKKIRNVDKMMEIARCSIFRTKVSKNRTI